MNALIGTILKVKKILAISSVLLLCFCFHAIAKQSVITEIRIIENPLSVRLSVSQFVPVKVIQVEKNELVVALKGVRLDPQFKITGSKKTAIRNVAVERLQGDVIAVVVSGDRSFSAIESGFDAANSNFVITLGAQKTEPVKKAKPEPVKGKAQTKPLQVEPKESETVQVKPSPEVPVPAKKTVPVKKSTEQVSDDEKQSVVQSTKEPVEPEAGPASNIPEPPVYIPPVRERSRFNGDISDLVKLVADAKCTAPEMTDAVMMLNKKMYADAYVVLDQYVTQDSYACVEDAFYLRGYAFYRQVNKEDFTQLMKAERLFQDALVSYPASVYVPYAYAAIGMIQKELNNPSAAEGYFNIVKQEYLAYSGLPEVLYHLAGIYARQGYLDKALRYYKQVFEDTSVNSYIADAGIGYGKALFEKKQYLDTLSVLNFVVESEPRKVYESQELLLHIGNANYEVGQSGPAREALTRAMNLFQEIRDPDVILSKVGDTYSMENNKEKAVKIYELVREKYPDTKGFVASSIGLARYMESDADKIEIYTMIKNKFPEDTYARIAMMRLAEIHQANGEYDKCINQIIELLSTQPRGLRYEAVKLMQKAYEALFEQQLKSGEYTKVLNRYELDHTRIDRMSSRRISFSVGLAYLEAKLFEEAFNHLITSYKQYKRSERSPELLFGLGLAMDESGRDEDALKLLNAFAQRFGKHKDREEALIRSGAIYLEKKKFAQASKNFNEAFRIAKSQLNKGRILMLHSAVFEKKGDIHTASLYHERAVKALALASGENYGILTVAYKELGRIYTQLKLYVKAADAYVKALSFSDDDGEKASLGFLLGDAYQKGNILPKAKEAYEQVSQNYDSVWARMAQQRLDTLELADTVQNS